MKSFKGVFFSFLGGKFYTIVGSPHWPLSGHSTVNFCVPFDVLIPVILTTLRSRRGISDLRVESKTLGFQSSSSSFRQLPEKVGMDQ